MRKRVSDDDVNVARRWRWAKIGGDGLGRRVDGNRKQRGKEKVFAGAGGGDSQGVLGFDAQLCSL